MKKYVFIVVFGVISSSLLYFYNFKRRILPKEIEKSLVYLVEDVKEICLHERFIQPFNPAVIQCEDHYVVVFRSTTAGWWSYVKRYLFKIHDEKNYWVRLDFNGKQISPVQELVVPCDEIGMKWSPEDFRFIEVRKEIYAVFNDQLARIGSKSPHKRSMYAAKFVFVGDRLEVQNRICLNFPGAVEFYKGRDIESFVEKNWTPFVFENAIHLLYTIDPLLVLRPNLETGECLEVFRENFHVSDLGFPRGGTPAIDVGDRFVSFYHVLYKGGERRLFGYLKGQCYYMSAFAFSKEAPFRIVGKIDAPLGAKNMYQKKKIVFPSSLIQQGEELYLFWGVDDRKMFMGRVPLDRLIGSFEGSLI